ncbi:hypothetical protein [Lacipirellula parvula]|uniref:Uncharacterized protein n=1 Tax=Lacipirellula parvula TaxID=2650471 RepID=A0A5K7XED8_9BACT|nr:hypothetical protein [Lacipirellula parvula]BBO31369.1 hypothetical protein PLANPX_0981 [Lacipirellula parvula]
MFHSFDMSAAIGNDDNWVERENILAGRMIATSYLAGNCEAASRQSARAQRRRKRSACQAWSADCFDGLFALWTASEGRHGRIASCLHDCYDPTPLMCN